MTTTATPPPRKPKHYRAGTLERGLRLSAAALVILAALAAGVWFFAKLRQPAGRTQVTPLNAPAEPVRPQAEIPTVAFTEITRSAGIEFVHVNGAYGDKLLPETMGGGAAFFDFDGDQDPDLLLVNSGEWPWKAVPGQPAPTMGLYRNDGGGRFTNVTAGSGLDTSFYGMGVAAGDYDNDGRVDVCLTGVGGCRLFHNLGAGRFLEVTAAAGVGGATNDWSTGAAWLDYDNDGRLDLFVGNYVRWSREIDFEVGYTLVGVGRAYGPPLNFEGAFPHLYRNQGDGTFADVTEGAGLQVRNPSTGVPVAKSLGVIPVDLDGDGWIDLVVANDTVPNFVFLNQRDGRFREVGAAAGVAFDSYGNTRGAMGIDAARFRNDRALGIVIGNFANEMTALYVSQQSSTNFADEAITEGIGPASRLLLKFGVMFFDYDLDGWLDLLSANGHLEDEIHKIQKSQTYAQPAQLFWNATGRGSAGFVAVPPAKAGPDLFHPIVGRGCAAADIDGDGDLDVLLTQVGGPPLLLRNDQRLGHHWLRIHLEGTRSNRDALGAWVTVRSGGLTQSRQVMPTRGYLTQSELTVTFGLGAAAAVESVDVQWPDGEKQALGPLAPDQVHQVRQAR